MTDSISRISISLSPALLRRLDDIADAQETTRSAVVRNAVERLCDSKNAGTADQQRLAMVAEYCQVALDMMLREKSPDRVKDVLAIVQGRMEKFHGAR